MYSYHFKTSIYQYLLIILILTCIFEQVVLSQAIKFADRKQNVKVSDMKRIRKNVIQIKVDCGNLCDTSIRAEKEVHKGKNRYNDYWNSSALFNIFNLKNIYLTDKIHLLFPVKKGKYVAEIVKEYDCDALFESPLFDQPLTTSISNIS